VRRMKILVALVTGFIVAGLGSANAAPVAKYYGAIDLGSKGTKGFLYSFANEAEGRDARVLFNRVVNTSLVSGMNGTNFTPDGIAEAADAVKQVLDGMKGEAQKRKLTDVEYYVVGSSGVAKGDNKADLAGAVKKATGLDMTFVNAKEEAYYAAISSVPKSQRTTSMLVDIGSGNTKLGCLVGAGDFKSAEIPFGSVTLRNAGVKKNENDIEAGIESVAKDEVGPAYKVQSMNEPCLANRRRMYWVGGAAWATASFSHPERALNGYVVIHHKDLDNFLARLKAGTWNQKNLVFEFPKDTSESERNAIRQKAEKDWTGEKGVQNVFSREDLFAGVTIMETVLEASNPSAVMVFARNGNYIFGYALEKYKEDAESGAE
jgi:exopolyphosphatase/pppGpp-phosphohydrolase